MNPPRENGLVFLPGTNVVESALAEGWVKLRESGKKDKSEDEEVLFAKLKAFEEQAKGDGKGVWSSESGKVDVKHDASGNEKGFLEQWKGKDIDGIS
jgi:endonuclease YncB( thermonuclease family)